MATRSLEMAVPIVLKRGDDSARERQQKEFAGIGRAVLQQRRGRVATGIDLHGIERDAGNLDVLLHVICSRAARVGLIERRGPET